MRLRFPFLSKILHSRLVQRIFHPHHSGRQLANNSSAQEEALRETDTTVATTKSEDKRQVAISTSSDTSKRKSSSTAPQKSGGAVTTSINALTLSLRLLAKAPLPGIDLATSVLLESIDRIRGLSANARGFDILLERMELLNPLVGRLPDKDPAVEQVSNRLIRELKQLSLDIDTAQDSGKIVSFFNNEDRTDCVQAHTQTIDSIVIDLSAIIGLDTNKQIKAALEKIRVSDAERVHSVDLTYADISTERPGAQGGNAMYKNVGSTLFEGSHSRIRTGGGHLFSENVV